MMQRFIVEHFVPLPGALIGAKFCAKKIEYDTVSNKITWKEPYLMRNIEINIIVKID
jgi:hypothetical protein